MHKLHVVQAVYEVVLVQCDIRGVLQFQSDMGILLYYNFLGLMIMLAAEEEQDAESS